MVPSGETKTIIAFDVGGTWTRFGLLHQDGTITDSGKERTVSLLTTNSPQERIQSQLVERIAQIAGDLTRCTRTGADQAVISFGGALNGHSGVVYNAAPIWGANTGTSFDFASSLRQRAPSLNWRLVNDISAHLAWYVTQQGTATGGKTALITVSSGIGCRFYDHRTRQIPIDAVLGIQGEIGHVPIAFNLASRRYHATCDCGRDDHLNAFCSGNALEKNFVDYACAMRGSPTHVVGEPKVATLRRLLDSGNHVGIDILAAITLPIAHAIQMILAIDPDVHQVAFTGGLFHTLSPYYLEAVRRHIQMMGVYLVEDHEPIRLRDLLTAAPDDLHAGLKGAAAYLRLCENQVEYPRISASLRSSAETHSTIAA